MKDFQYDYTNLIKQKLPLHNNEAFDKLIKSYLFTHQFSEDILLSREDVLLILEYFIEEDEYVFENDDKLIFILNKKNNIYEVLKFLQWLLKIMSIKIIEHKIINKTNLIITVKNYANTFNRSRTEELYF